VILLAPQGQYKGVRSRKVKAPPPCPTTIEAKVREIVADILCVDEEELMLGTSLVDDLEIDFQDRVEIVMGLEEEFGMQISEAKGEGLKKFGDLVTLVYKQKSTGEKA
jgi:acyl carrier protein